jgi:hypothetical protein
LDAPENPLILRVKRLPELRCVARWKYIFIVDSRFRSQAYRPLRSSTIDSNGLNLEVHGLEAVGRHSKPVCGRTRVGVNESDVIWEDERVVKCKQDFAVEACL